MSHTLFPNVLRPQNPFAHNFHGTLAGVATSGVAAPNGAFRDMFRRWELIVHLMGGTLAMQDASTKYLPQEPKEEDRAYTNRLARSILYNAYRRTVHSLAGFPFQRPVIAENIPENLQYLSNETVDNGERDLTNFARDTLVDLLNFGKAHILVDFPKIDGELSLGDEQRLSIRPYFVQVSPLNLIGWDGRRVGSLEVLDNVRIAEETTVQDENFEEHVVNRIRVIYPDRFEVWEQQESSSAGYQLIDEQPNELGFIPLVTIYANRTGFMEAEPPLEDLAWLNLQHWQKLSDLENIIHVSCVPFLFGAGFAEGELENAEIGPNRAIATSEPNSKLSYVEHSGSAINTAQNSLKDLETRMATVGADFLTQRSVSRQTATARQIDQSESLSALQSMVRNLESGLEQAFRFAGAWTDTDVGDIKIEIGDNLDLIRDANENELVRTLWADGFMTPEQLTSELKRRGVLSDTFELQTNPTVQRDVDEQED